MRRPYDGDSGYASTSHMSTTKDSKNNNDNDGIKGFEFLIPFINTLQTLFKAGGISKDIIQLPQIVVVGAQVSYVYRN